jgi:hypothetical protein
MISPAGCAFPIRCSDRRRKDRPLQGRPVAEIAEKTNHCVARRAREKFFCRFANAASQRHAEGILIFEAFAASFGRHRPGRIKKNAAQSARNLGCGLAFP